MVSGCSNDFIDVFSGSANQAAFAKLKSAAIGITGQRWYGQSELNQYSLVAAAPAGNGYFAIQADYFGFSEYNESMLGIGYSRKISTGISLGVKANYFSQNTSGYGKASSINFEGGALFQLTPELTGGLHVYNPLSSRLSDKSEDRLPCVYKSSLGYQTSKNFLIGVSVVSEENMPVDVQAGVIYRIYDKVQLRAGVATSSGNHYAGIAIQTGLLRIDLNASYHAHLGVSPALLMQYTFTKPVEN